MKLACKRSERTCADGALSFKLMALMTAAFAAMAFTLEAADDPGWWTSRGAINSNPKNDYAAVTQGQLKQFTARAVDELNANLTNYGGAGTALTNLVYGWQQDYATNSYNATNIEPSDYQAMNVGQLKYIASLVYGQLAAAGYTELTPSWLHQNTNSDNMVANIGQLKRVFDFDLSLPGAASLTATAGTPGTINLSWTLPSTNNVTSWLVEQQNTNGSWNVITNLTNPDATSYAVTGLTNGQSYNFQVIASATNSVSLPVSGSATTQPVPSTGLVLWLKADADVTQDGSGNVSAWQDQSSAGNNASQSTSGNQPVAVANNLNGKPVIRFNGSTSYLANASLVSSSQTFTTFVVATPDTNGAGPFYNGTFGVNGWGYVRNTSNLSLLFGGQAFTYFGPYSTAPAHQIFCATRTSDPIATYYVDGVQSGSTSTTAMNTPSGSTIIGCDSIGYGYYYTGDIAEVLIYNRALTDTEREQAEGYLADKYGLYDAYATWPSSYSSTVQAEITKHQWSKAQADAYVAFQAANPTMLTTGLSLWLKADAGVTQSSGSVSAWADQTGNYPVAQSSGGSEPTYVASDVNSEPALRFNGSQRLFNPSTVTGLNADCTLIEVGSTSSSGSQQYSIYLGAGNGSGYQNRAIGYDVSQELYDTSVGYSLIGASPAPNTFVTEIGTLDSTLSNVTFWRNGAEVGTGTLSGAENLSAGITVGSTSDPSSGWQGDIAEVLVYDHKLTSDELAQVDGYLADKYGIYDPNATWPSAYSSAVQTEITKHQWSKAQAVAYVAFQAANPTMLTTGLSLWLKADAGVTQSSGSVSAWADQTGNYSVAQSTSGFQPTVVSSDINGKPALRFSGGQALTNPSGMGLNSDLTIIEVGTTTSSSGWQYAVWLGSSSSARGLGYQSSDQVFHNGTNGVFGGGTPNPNTFVTEEATLDSTCTNVAFYRNGASTATGTISGCSAMGSGITVGEYGGGSLQWNGDIAEVLVYDHKLSSDELAQVDGYLADKYGLYSLNATWPSAYSSAVQALITANQWNKAQADAYVAFAATDPPVPSSGLSVWLKADSSVTADPTTHKVSQWADQSPNANNANQSTGGSQPTLVSSSLNGKPVVRFDGASSYLDITDNSSVRPSSGITVYALIKPNTTYASGTNGDVVAKALDNIYEEFSWGYPLYSYDLGLGGNNTAYSYLSTGTGSSNPLTGGAAQNQTAQITSLVYDSTAMTPTATVTTDGVTQVSQVVSGGGSLFYNTSAEKDLIIGAANSPIGLQRYFNGDVAEVMVYNRALTTTEQQQVEGYLADKYGIYDPNATWFNSAPYLAIKDEITKHQWSEAQANNYLALQTNNPTMLTTGLSLWLKADAGVTTSSGNVTAIADQTGNYTLTQSTTGNQPSYVASDLNGEPGLRFSGSQWLSYSSETSDPGLNADITIITVGTTSDPIDLTYSIYLGQNTTAYQNRASGYLGGYELFDTGTGSYNGSPAYDANTFIIETTTVDSSLANVAFYQNGGAAGTGTMSGVENLSSGITFGAAGGGYSGWQGDIAEVLVYDHKLSSDELQQVTLYLATKYGLPYDQFTAPTISPSGGSYTSSQTVTLANAATSGTIHYTLDGTEPTTSSPTYTAPFTLTGSALVNAAIFFNGAISSPTASSQFYVNDTDETGLPTAATSLTANVISGSEIDLGWSLSGQVNYSTISVYRSSDSGATWQLVAVLDPSTTSYVDTNVQAGSCYKYYVGTLNTSGESDTAHSSSVRATAATPFTITVTTPSTATPL